LPVLVMGQKFLPAQQYRDEVAVNLKDGVRTNPMAARVEDSCPFNRQGYPIGLVLTARYPLAAPWAPSSALVNCYRAGRV
jgi:hypothetical protein